MIRLVAVLAVAAALAAGGQYPLNSDALGSISGQVVHDRTGRPMPRVQVVLRPSSGDGTAAAAVTGRDGRFHFRRLPSAYYALGARHAGYLPSSHAETEHTRLPYVFGLMPGENLEGIVVRLRPAGVVSGRVEFTDGEPAVGIPVEFFREYFYRGRHGFQPVGSASTDDRGQYRLFGLPPGRYYLVAAYSPPSAGPGVREERALDENGRPLPDDDFVTTFHPSAHRMMEAIPVRVRAGEELENTHITLVRARTGRIQGQVVSGVTGEPVAGADIRLRQPSPVAEVMVDAPVAVRPRQRGGFEIVGVTPGSYTLQVNAREDGVPLTGRIPVTVSGHDVENVELTLQPYKELSGRLVTGDTTDFPLSRFRVSLEPHSDSIPATSASVDKDGKFSISFVPGETYDVFLQEGPPEVYLKSARIGGFDVLRTGFTAESGDLPPMELHFSTRGASVRGEVAETSTKVALGSTVALIPEPAQGKMQHYQTTTTDAYGLYEFRGVAPGRYTVAAWWDEPPCEVYDLESLEACRQIGKSIEVREGEERTLNLELPK